MNILGLDQVTLLGGLLLSGIQTGELLLLGESEVVLGVEQLLTMHVKLFCRWHCRRVQRVHAQEATLSDIDLGQPL